MKEEEKKKHQGLKWYYADTVYGIRISHSATYALTSNQQRKMKRTNGHKRTNDRTKKNQIKQATEQSVTPLKWNEKTQHCYKISNRIGHYEMPRCNVIIFFFSAFVSLNTRNQFGAMWCFRRFRLPSLSSRNLFLLNAAKIDANIWFNFFVFFFRFRCKYIQVTIPRAKSLVHHPSNMIQQSYVRYIDRCVLCCCQCRWIAISSARKKKRKVVDSTVCGMKVKFKNGNIADGFVSFDIWHYEFMFHFSIHLPLSTELMFSLAFSSHDIDFYLF